MCSSHNSKSPISQADGLKVLGARAFRPFASFFFLYAVLQLPREVSCLGKEEIWTVEREEREKKNQTTNKTQTFFLSTSAGYMGIA